MFWQHNSYRKQWLTLHIPRTNSELGRIAFKHSAPHTWNELQKSLN
uniref:Uncharacterized protein n=1 Tax=Anguilla anguilla TaxID=7936 RepID=A0A0E9T1X6_ANGAN